MSEPTTVEQLLMEARARLTRLLPGEARAASYAGAALIDIRSERQRARDGKIPGAKYIARNVLEWRLDPSSPDRDRDLARRDIKLILICDEGYQSSLAAATLTRFGLNATDVIGGFQAWRNSRLARAAHISPALSDPAHADILSANEDGDPPPAGE